MARRTICPSRLVFAGLLFFCCEALAASAVLGIDLGTEYIKAALVKPGIPLEIVLTKDSRRKETAAVAFKTPQNGAKAGVYPERAYGSDAIALGARFPGDVYPNLKTILGLTIENPVVEEYMSQHPSLQPEPAFIDRATVAFKSAGAFTDSEDAWMVESLLAMQLKSMRRNAEALAGPDTSVRAAVISVPPFYTAAEKRAIGLAANLAGLRVLSLISDGLSVGLHYATSRQFPSVSDNEKPELHMIFDMGAGSTKATVLRFQSRSVKDVGKFNKTIQEIDVLGSGWDRTLGGDALNALIIDDMVTQFVNSKAAQAAGISVDEVRGHGRTIAKLAKEAERIRHVLSANINTAASMESLHADIDFKYKIARTDFETMANAHSLRVNIAVQDALRMAGLTVRDLDSLILHGGATRTPFVQKQLEQILGGSNKMRTNVNSDEAAVLGAGFRAAELSPSFRVKEIRVHDGAAYGVAMKPNATTTSIAERRLWIPTSYIGPSSAKTLRFEGDELKAELALNFYQQVPGDSIEKSFSTSNLTDTVDTLVEKFACEPSSIQLAMEVRLSAETGEVEVTKAVATCESESPNKESLMDGVKNLFGFGKKDQQPLDEEVVDVHSSSSSSSFSTSSSSSASDSSTFSSTSTSTSESTWSSAAAKPHAKVPVSIPIKFILENAGVRQLSDIELSALKKRLQAFDASDRARVLREESFNRLESLTYQVRSLLENDDFNAASTAAESALLESMCSNVSDWLYDGGVDASHEELNKKYKELKTAVSAIEDRIIEAANRPNLVAGLKQTLEQSREFAQTIRDRIAEYDAFHSRKSRATVSPTTTTTSGSPMVSLDADFVGLEEHEASVSASETTGAADDMGPPSPIYTAEDLKELEDLIAYTEKWLIEKETVQAKLNLAADPVLLSKDLEARRERLDKISMELAMKAIRGLEKAQKKGGKSSKSKSKKSKTKSPRSSMTMSSSSAEAEPTQSDEGIKHEEL
ncbi:lumenal Hsp70 protein [Sporothrix epigloea]|uniref:Lumenal Hsp70 protein n=1 Tax=Sporothrix epigloea TaxID=1892477 RepID=A0ABP0DUT7_9PEZI